MAVDSIIAKTSSKKIESMCKLMAGPFGSAFDVGNYEEGSDYRYVRGQDVKDFFLGEDSTVSIPKSEYERLSAFGLIEGDILLSVVGTIGNSVIILPDNLPAIYSCKSTLLRCHDENPYYLLAFLNSELGKSQLLRRARGTVQMGLNLPDIRSISVPVFSEILKETIANTVKSAHASLLNSRVLLKESEQTLLQALGLENWSPPEPLTYTRKAAEVWEAGRLDADYYAPQKQEAIYKLATPGSRPLRDYCDSIRDMVDPTRAAPQKLVRNFDLTDALNPVLDDEMEPVLFQSVGSMKKRFRTGDVVISRLRAYLKEIAVVRTSGDIHAVGSSEFIVLRPKEGVGLALTPETLSIFLRSMPVQLILQYCQDGSHHPRFSESDLLSIPVPEVVFSLSTQLDAQLNAALLARHRAAGLLERAKRAVEIAIEQSEEAALAYLEV